MKENNDRCPEINIDGCRCRYKAGHSLMHRWWNKKGSAVMWGGSYEDDSTED